MAKRIKFSLLKIFFKLFSFLADKTDGWKIFVTPKLLLGTALLLSGNACGQKSVSQNINQDDNVNLQTTDTVSKKEIDEDIVYCYFIDVKAKFPGGEKEMMKWLNANLQIPPNTGNLVGTYKVFVDFVVDTHGNITNVKIVRSSNVKVLDDEAIRVVKSMPQWEAGQQYKYKVNSHFTLPITFILKKDEE